jgi:hypothetical protein
MQMEILLELSCAYGSRSSRDGGGTISANLNPACDADSPKIDATTKQVLLDQCDQLEAKIGG